MLGSYILVAFSQNERYNVTALVRPETDTSSIPAWVRLVHIDYESRDSLVSALQGQNVLISALGKSALQHQSQLVDAAIAARVGRIIPSEFGANLMNRKTRSFPTYASKVILEEQLVQKCKLNNLSYTLVYTNCLLDWAISGRGALLLAPAQRRVKLYDGGNNRFSTTSMATVGRAVVAVLDHYDETANRAVYVQDIAISNNEILELVNEVVAGEGGQEWSVLHIDTEEAEKCARLAFGKGNLTPEVFYGLAVRAAFAPGYGGLFTDCDNELLGIQEMGRDELKQLIRKVLSEEAQLGVGN